MVGGEDLAALVFSVLGLPLTDSGDAEREDDDVDGDDFILASSASRAGAKVLTTVSRSDCFDKDWRADVSSSFFAKIFELLNFRIGDDLSVDDRLSQLLLGGERFSSLLLGEDRLSRPLERDRYREEEGRSYHEESE